MTSVLGLERSLTSTANAYDHAIDLVDSTRPKDEAVESGDASSDSINTNPDGEGSQLNRQWTRPHLRKELARRKFAKWQNEAEEETGPRTSTENNDDNAEHGDGPKKPTKQGTWGTQGRLRDKVPFRSKKKKTQASAEDTTFIDVLYENQRGSFFCGIPLYSANSLLNLDPSAWQNSTFQDSPVNITNAQVPDPSWVWDWRSWYVDMSHDVDEEGWEYSFSFSPNFAWHGNHPWFHSFCRRRRWLRKRVKIHGRLGRKHDGEGIKDEHQLNADYFTIHAPRRDRSRSTSGDRSATRRSSTMAGFEVVEDDVEDWKEIPDVSTLMTAMKRARVDREKISAVKQFLAQGGDELFYLADNVAVIMDDFIYPTSRQQMQTYFLRALDDAIKARDSPQDKNEDSEKKEAPTRRITNLLKTIDTAGIPSDSTSQSYLTTLKARAAGEEEANDSIDQSLNDSADPTSPYSPPHSPHPHHPIDSGDNPAAHIEQEAGFGSGDDDDEIRGISKNAEISVEPGIRRPGTEVEGLSSAGGNDMKDGVEEKVKKIDKGKGKEKEKV